MPDIPFNFVVDPKRIIINNGGPRMRRGTRGRWPKKIANNEAQPIFDKINT
jgi:hypothetical protein